MRVHKITILGFVATAALAAQTALAQLAAPPIVGSQPSEANQDLRSNTFEPGQPAALTNKIVTPIPLTAAERDTALAGIDKHIAADVATLKEKLKGVLPDEIAILAKTSGWTSENQQALVTALRAGDPTAVLQAWSQGNPKDTAGGEIVARQVSMRKVVTQLEQDLSKNQASVVQDVADLEMALSKITATTPAAQDLEPIVDSLNNWVQVRKLVEAAAPQKGPVAKLPTGKIQLIYDPGLEIGTAIVLGADAMLIGNQGKGPLSIASGNAAEALGLPIVNGVSVPALEGEPMTAGTLLVNPSTTKTTINYNVNGNHYLMEPGMAQRLPPGASWVVEYDRGQNYGPAAYTLGPGTFYFTPSDEGLQLFEQSFDVVIDNTQNKQEFNAIVDGKNFTVPAGGTRKIAAPFPIAIRFDRGNGGEFVTKMISFSGNVEVGVNADDNLWDIFPTNDNQRAVTKLKLFQ
ncbi:MAG: hypothetical protein JNL96_17680 [Planctomycetaceae bacterium]|nr:hypothetical protein [Planctomycetaceae bacterium]